MQSIKIFLSLVLLVSHTARCANHRQEAEFDDSPIIDRSCFLKELSNKEGEDISNFNVLIICVAWDSNYLSKNFGSNKLTQKKILFKTLMAELSIQGQKNIESFFRKGNPVDYLDFDNRIKNIWNQKQMNLKILDNPSINENSEEQTEKNTIIEITSPKKIELSLIKEMSNLKLRIPVEDDAFASFIEPDTSKVPEMRWDNKSMQIFDESFSEFIKFLVYFASAYEEDNIEHFLEQEGFSVESIEYVKDDSSVIDILSKYFGEEARKIH